MKQIWDFLKAAGFNDYATAGIMGNIDAESGMRSNNLQDTYGILIYQEQFMQISRSWCGFTGGQADTLRKAVGKKKMDLMKKVKPEFVEGAIKVGGATREIAETFWDQLLEFANYCFNKSNFK